MLHLIHITFTLTWLLIAGLVAAEPRNCPSVRIDTRGFGINAYDIPESAHGPHADDVCECAKRCDDHSDCDLFAYGIVSLDNSQETFNAGKCFLKSALRQRGQETVFKFNTNLRIRGSLSINPFGQIRLMSKQRCIDQCISEPRCQYVVMTPERGDVYCSMDEGNEARTSVIGFKDVPNAPPISPQPPVNPVPVPPVPGPSPSPSTPNQPSDPSNPSNPSSPISSEAPPPAETVSDITIITETAITVSGTVSVFNITRTSRPAGMTRVPSSTAEGPLRTFSGSVGPLITDLDGVGAVTATSGPSSGDGSGNGISVVLGIGIAAAVIGAAVIIAGIVYGLRRNALAQKKERDWDELVTLDRGAGGGGANLTGSAAGVGFGLAAGAAAAGSKNREEEISMRKMSQTGNMSTNITIEREMTQRRTSLSAVFSVMDAPSTASPAVPIAAASAAATTATTPTKPPTSTNAPLLPGLPTYTKPFTLEQYLAAGWTVEQLNIVKPPMLPSAKGVAMLATGELAVEQNGLERTSTVKSEVEPMQSH